MMLFVQNAVPKHKFRSNLLWEKRFIVKIVTRQFMVQNKIKKEAPYGASFFSLYFLISVT